MSKLTDHKIFEGKLVQAWTEPCYRMTDYPGEFRPTDYNRERFNFIVDEQDNALAVVTENYTLVQNRELISALDLAAEDLNLELEPHGARYDNGRGVYQFQVPELELDLKQDPSKSICTIQLHNDYRGSESLKLIIGWFRFACENLQLSSEVAPGLGEQATRRHVGEIPLYDWIFPRLAAVHDRFLAERLVAQILADTFVPKAYQLTRSREAATEAVKAGNAHIIDRLIADTAERYQLDLLSTIRNNATNIGHNLWAIAQAVSEVATHRMQRTATGAPRTRYNAGADQWATRQYQRIVEYAKIEG